MKDLWERITYEVWWLSRVVPRLRFCRRRWCPKVVAAYPMVRPTLCHKHRVEDWRKFMDEHKDNIPTIVWPPKGSR